MAQCGNSSYIISVHSGKTDMAVANAQFQDALISMAMLVYQRVINNKDHVIFSDFVAAGGIANLGELCTDALITTYGLQRVAIVSWLHVIVD